MRKAICKKCKLQNRQLLSAKLKCLFPKWKQSCREALEVRFARWWSSIIWCIIPLSKSVNKYIDPLRFASDKIRSRRLIKSKVPKRNYDVIAIFNVISYNVSVRNVFNLFFPFLFPPISNV